MIKGGFYEEDFDTYSLHSMFCRNDILLAPAKHW